MTGIWPTTLLTMAGIIMSTSNIPAAGGFRLPAVVSRTLSNGVRVYAMEYHELPLVDFQVVIRAGAAQDPKGREGLADLVSDLLRKGTATRSATEIAEAVDFVGGSLDAGADQDGTRISAEFLRKDLDLGLDLLADTVMHPAFAPEEVDRLKSETIGELQAMKENPGALVGRRFIELLYGDHPYGHPTSGWEGSVGAITRDDVRAFYEAHYQPDNVIVVAVGDFEAARMIDVIDRKLSAWTGKAAVAAELPHPAPLRKRTIYLIDKPDSTQSQIRIGALGIRRSDPDYIPVMVANTIMGGGFTSRLVEEIRVNRGLSYGAGSRFYALVESGPFVVNTFTKSATTRETVEVALEVLEGFRKDGPTAEEVDKAGKYLKGAFAIAHQSPDALADVLAEIAFHNLPLDYYDTYLDRLAAVSREDLKRVAASRFPFERLNIVVLGEAAAVRKDLETLGPVTPAPLSEH